MSIYTKEEGAETKGSKRKPKVETHSITSNFFKREEVIYSQRVQSPFVRIARMHGCPFFFLCSTISSHIFHSPRLFRCCLVCAVTPSWPSHAGENVSCCNSLRGRRVSHAGGNMLLLFLLIVYCCYPWPRPEKSFPGFLGWLSSCGAVVI
jgi:hypothetical protein